MKLPRTAFAAGALIVTGLLSATADAQVTFFSRSGRTSHFAAGVHGYGKTPDGGLPHGVEREARRVGYRGHVVPVWRETRRVEIRPSVVIPRGDHFEVVPGRYRYEGAGAWGTERLGDEGAVR